MRLGPWPVGAADNCMKRLRILVQPFEVMFTGSPELARVSLPGARCAVPLLASRCVVVGQRCLGTSPESFRLAIHHKDHRSLRHRIRRHPLARSYASILVSGAHASSLFTELAARLVE